MEDEPSYDAEDDGSEAEEGNENAVNKFAAYAHRKVPTSSPAGGSGETTGALISFSPAEHGLILAEDDSDDDPPVAPSKPVAPKRKPTSRRPSKSTFLVLDFPLIHPQLSANRFGGYRTRLVLRIRCWYTRSV